MLLHALEKDSEGKAACAAFHVEDAASGREMILLWVVGGVWRPQVGPAGKFSSSSSSNPGH